MEKQASSPASPHRRRPDYPRSLSDLIKSAAKSGKTVHFSPVFGANRTTIRLKPVKNCPRLPLFSLRPIKPDRLLGCVAISANAAKPVVDLSDLVDRQLIVLFSATTVGLKAKFVAGAASNAAVDGALHARLGAPSAGARLLEGMPHNPCRTSSNTFLILPGHGWKTMSC